MTVIHLRKLHEFIAQPPVFDGDDGSYKAGFSRCVQEVFQFLEKESGLSIAQKSRLLSHLTSVVPALSNSCELNNNATDDSASSCSSSSRSGTPSSTLMESSPMEYVPRSPFSDTSNSLSSPSRTIFSNRTAHGADSLSTASNGNRLDCKNSFSIDMQNSNQASGRVILTNGFLVSDSNHENTNFILNRPLNLASSSSRDNQKEENVNGHFMVDNEHSRRLIMNKSKECRTSFEISGNGVQSAFPHRDEQRMDFAPENNLSEEHHYVENVLMDKGSVLAHMDPVWRPW
ncbi:uncharacterized protein LOC118203078 isoform X2 [Stegodyphus dumicola]|nr:uncharacterized protein LOC118203078 isoform X2 [Stegodyphus dumicola]